MLLPCGGLPHFFHWLPRFTAMTSSITQGICPKIQGLDSLEILPPLTPQNGSAVGARMYALKGAQLKLILCSLENPIRFPFEAGNFEQDLASTRVNACYDSMTQIKRCSSKQLALHLPCCSQTEAQNVSNKAVTGGQIRLMYNTSLTTTHP